MNTKIFPGCFGFARLLGVFCKHQIKSLDEIRNAKFRSVNAQLWIELTKLYGAIPEPMPHADAYMAFKLSKKLLHFATPM